MTMTPEMQKAVRDVQIGFAKQAKKRALDLVTREIELNPDVIGIQRKGGAMFVEMASGVILRIEAE